MALDTFSPALLTVDTNAYASGDLIGTHSGGKLTFTNVLGKGSQEGWLRQVVILDRSNQKSALDLLLFNADPSATTFTDNSAFAVHADDMDKVIALVPVAAADYVSVSTTLAVYVKDWERPLKAAASTLYGALVCRGTPTYTNAAHLTLRLTISK